MIYRARALVAAALTAFTVGGCANADEPGETAATTPAETSSPTSLSTTTTTTTTATPKTATPTPSVRQAAGETVRVNLATALACRYLDEETARFSPLEVDGAEATEVEGCQEQEIFNSYVYDVQLPQTGDVTVTPGNQPPATFDAAQAVAAGAVTIFYARKGAGQYELSRTVYGKDDAVASAP